MAAILLSSLLPMTKWKLPHKIADEALNCCRCCTLGTVISKVALQTLQTLWKTSTVALKLELPLSSVVRPTPWDEYKQKVNESC